MAEKTIIYIMLLGKNFVLIFWGNSFSKLMHAAEGRKCKLPFQTI
jgi:hypothetical protein